MALTLVTDTTLDVVSKQKELVQEALGPDGVYIRLKETLLDLLSAGELTGAERADAISQTMSQMSGQITSACMSTGLQWAMHEKELALKKEEMQYQLDLISKQTDKMLEDTKNALAEKQLKQASLRRLYGTPTLDASGNVIALGNDGKEYESILNVRKDTEVKEQTKLRLADEIVTSSKQREVMDTQKALYTRQKEAFDDNKYQKLFEAQLTYNGVVFQDATSPDVLDVALESKVNDVFNRIINSGNPVNPMPE